MFRKSYLLIGILLLIVAGCNDKYICHNCTAFHFNRVGIDWRLTEKPDESCPEIIEITYSDGRKFSLGEKGGVDEFGVELEDGEYHVFLGDDVDHISYDDNSVTVDRNGDGTLCEPEAFSAGETMVEIKDNEMVTTNKVVMIRQTRELIVKLRILSGLTHFREISGFDCRFDGVTESRDIAHGFAPHQEIDRPMKATVQGSVEMAFTRDKQLSEEESVSVYLSRYRLIGIDETCQKTLAFSYREGDTPAGEERCFFTLDATDMIPDFHTLEEVSEPYILLLDIAEDAVTGRWSVQDWMIGDETDLVATER